MGTSLESTRGGSTPWPTILIVATAAAGLWWYGAGYYLLPFDQRPDAPQHDLLGSARLVGHGLGWAGTLMMVLLMAYSLRKHLRRLQGLGSLGDWLSAHIFLGLMGPLLITFHSAFKVGGLVSISYWSMVVTMLSGIFGRYLYVQIPSSVIGGHRSLADLQAESDQLGARLADRLGTDHLGTGRLDAVTGDGHGGWDPRSTGWRAIGALLLHDLGRPWRSWRLTRRLLADTGLPRRDVRAIVRLARRREILQRRTAAAESMERIFHYWHVLHRPFVWIMFLIAALHIGVAWWLGYRGF